VSIDTYIRSISAKVPKYTRNSNEILRNEFLYEGGRPSYVDPADYSYGQRTVKGVRLG